MAPSAVTTNAGADGSRPGDIHRNYLDDRMARDEDCLYTTSNGVPMPHPVSIVRNMYT